MAVEDYLEPEVGVAVAVTAAIASPKVRGVLRRGAVYGLAGVLMAGDAVASLVRGVQRGTQSASAEAAPAQGTPVVNVAAQTLPTQSTSEENIESEAAAQNFSAGQPDAAGSPVAAETFSPGPTAEAVAEPAEQTHKRARKIPEAAAHE